MKIKSGMSGYIPYKGFHVEDIKDFTKACYEIAELNQLSVQQVIPNEDIDLYSTYNYAVLTDRENKIGIVGHIHFPLLTFVKPINKIDFGWDYPEFVEPNDKILISTKNLSKYSLIQPFELNENLSEDNFSELNKSEIKAIKYFKPKKVGHVLFNCWD